MNRAPVVVSASTLERARVQNDFASLVPARLHSRSGSVFYSGRSAFSTQSSIYLLGLNPGGSPTAQSKETIGRDLTEWNGLPERWSAYADESWMGMSPGTCGLQPRVLHLFKRLQMNPRDIPASNVVFVRSSTEAALSEEKGSLLEACWPVHRRVIARLGVRVIVCLGTTAGAWVRDAVGATSLVDEYQETNKRGWRSQTHRNKDGLQVVTLSHPSRADWTNPASDPSLLVQRAIDREGSITTGPIATGPIATGPTTLGSTMMQLAPPMAPDLRPELMNPPRISAAAVRSAHMHLLETATNMKLRAEPHTSAISAIKLYGPANRYLFSWIINPHHLLFYIRKPALKLAPYLARAARERLTGVNINPAGEVTVRIESIADAQALTGWLFNPTTWTITALSGPPRGELSPGMPTEQLSGAGAPKSQNRIR